MKTCEQNDPYAILGVKKDASDKEIKQAFKKAALKYHPDKHNKHDNSNYDENKFNEVKNAYETIIECRKNELSTFLPNKKQSSPNVNDVWGTSFSFDNIFNEMENRIKFINEHHKKNTVDNEGGSFYSKRVYTCTRNGKTVTKIEENLNGDQMYYESYDDRKIN